MTLLASLVAAGWPIDDSRIVRWVLRCDGV